MDLNSPRRSRRLWIALTAYAILLVVSHLAIARQRAEPAWVPAGAERVALTADSSALSALHWEGAARGTPSVAGGACLPILLLHGSPGEAADLAELAARLAGEGREVLSIDLPGFGESRHAPGGRSILAHAQSALAAVPWSEFHVAAWSMGGGVALHMARLAPGRVRSLSLIASIGVQEAEGSGSFVFEHIKYALMWVLLVPGVDLVPHFGVLGQRAARRSFCRNFWESDQRPLRSMLPALTQPLLFAHGRSDFLVPFWCAEESHELASHSRLLVFDAGHFLIFDPPFGQLDRLAPELSAFLSRHDVAGVSEPRARLDFATASDRARPEPFWLPRRMPWWLALGACVCLARASPVGCGLAVGVLCALLQLDLGLGLIGALLGSAWRALRTPLGSPMGWLADLARAFGACLAASVFAVWAGPRLCGLAGPLAGALLTVASPLLVLLAALAVVRRRRSRRTPGAS